MNIIETMNTMYDQFTKTEKRITDYMVNHIDIVSRSSASDLSNLTGFSPASLTRFVKKLGFENYSQFIYQVQRDMSKDSNEKMDAASMYFEIFKEMDYRCGREQIQKICSYFKNADMIYITGFHISKTIAVSYTDHISTLRYHAKALAYDKAFKMDSYVTNKDLVIIISAYSDIYKEYVKNLWNLESRPKIMLITMSQKHTLAHLADEVVILPSSASIGSSRYTDQTIVYQYFLLKLLNELEEKA